MSKSLTKNCTSLIEAASGLPPRTSSARSASLTVKKLLSEMRSSVWIRYASAVTSHAPLFQTRPSDALRDSSGVSASAPKNWAIALFGDNTAVSRNWPLMKDVVTCSAFDWPGVGARKPVLTAPRRANVSVKS